MKANAVNKEDRQRDHATLWCRRRDAPYYIPARDSPYPSCPPHAMYSLSKVMSTSTSKRRTSWRTTISAVQVQNASATLLLCEGEEEEEEVLLTAYNK